MGVLAVGVGKLEEALPFFKTALEVNSSIAQFWLSYIDALIKLDQADAKANVWSGQRPWRKGDGFDQVEKRLGGPARIKNSSSNVQDPTQDQLQSLIALYTKGKYEKVLIEASQMLLTFQTLSSCTILLALQIRAWPN